MQVTAGRKEFLKGVESDRKPFARRAAPGSRTVFSMASPQSLLSSSAAMTFLGITMGAESIWVFIGGYVGVTVGVGVVSTVANSLDLTSAPSERTGVAASVSETALQLGSALGIAGFGTVAALAYRSTMPGHAPQAPPAAQDSITGAQSIAADLPPDQAHELLVAAREA